MSKPLPTELNMKKYTTPEIGMICGSLQITEEEYHMIENSGFVFDVDTILLEKLGRFNDGSDTVVKIKTRCEPPIVDYCSPDLTEPLLNLINTMRKKYEQ